jgi:hypothetical protein
MRALLAGIRLLELLEGNWTLCADCCPVHHNIIIAILVTSQLCDAELWLASFGEPGIFML